MPRIRNTLSWLLLGIMLISCSEEQPREKGFFKSPNKNVPLSIEKAGEFVLYGPDSLNIAAPTYRFAGTNDGKQFAFFDVGYSRFLITDAKGKVIRTIGKKGRGPYEFQQVTNYNFSDDGKLIAYDQILRLIKIFNPDGSLGTTLKVSQKRFYISGASLSIFGGNIYIGIREAKYTAKANPDVLSGWKSKYFVIYPILGGDPELFGFYDPYLKHSYSYYDRPVFVFDKKNKRFYTTHQNDYRVQAFDPISKKRTAYFGYKSKHFGELEQRLDKNLSREEKFRRSLNESDTGLIGITDKYIILCFINGSEEWLQTKDLSTLNYYAAIYDRSTHDFLSEIKLPYRFSLIQNNKLYLTEDENPAHYTIGVYEIH